MKLYRHLFALSVFVMLLAQHGHACSCDCGLESVSKQELLNRAPSIFYGRAVDVASFDRPEYVFVVERSWKGVHADVVTVGVVDEGVCKSKYQVGAEYLVYATESGGKLLTTYCSAGCAAATIGGNDIKHAIAALGPGRVHKPVYYFSTRLKRQIALFFLIALTVAVPLVVARRKRKQTMPGGAP
jgi:hypothetical protein